MTQSKCAAHFGNRSVFLLMTSENRPPYAGTGVSFEMGRSTRSTQYQPVAKVSPNQSTLQSKKRTKCRFIICVPLPERRGKLAAG